MKYTCLFPGLLSMLLLISCNTKNPVIEDKEAFAAEYQQWQTSRLDRLKSESGWLNLAGLFWLDQGVNSFGSGDTNNIRFPENFPGYAGDINLSGDSISISVNSNVLITAGGIPVKEMTLRHDQEMGTTILEHENFRWFIIQRGEKYGIRLRDLEHPRINALDHIPSYPLSEKWVIEAEFIPFDSAVTIEVPTVINNFSEFYEAPGKLEFKINGKTHSLIPFSSGKGYFLIVGDATNGIDTYGAGRFMYTDQVEGNRVILDFNRAYNPPCAFSPFATCPLPPLENILDVKITAGEKGIHLE